MMCYGRPALAAEMEAHRGTPPLGGIAGADGAFHPGVTVFGILPIGSAEYVMGVLSRTCESTARIARKRITLLGQEHSPELWTLTRTSTNYKGEYVARPCPSDDSKELTERLAFILSLQAMAALGVDPSADWLAVYRMPADPRGLSSLAAGRHAAFPGAVSTAISSFLALGKGVFDRSCIESWIGRASFTDGAADCWVQHLGEGSQV